MILTTIQIMEPSPINEFYFQEIEFTPLEEFEFWLSEMEDKLVATTAKKPGNRVEACQLLATGQKLQGRWIEKIFNKLRDTDAAGKEQS